MPYINVDVLKQKYPIDYVATKLGLELTKTDKGQYRSACPSGEGNNRSLVISPDDGAFYSFAKNKGGGIVQLVQLATNLSFKQALQWISELPPPEEPEEDIGYQPPPQEETKTETKRIDVYQQVTDSIIQAIEQGVDNFSMPWHKGQGQMPCNISSGNTYQGINVLTLWVTAQERGYSSPTWGTYKQWKEVTGLKVKHGEKCAHIIFFNKITKEEDDGEKRTYPIIKSYAVFNGDQIDGYQEPDIADVPQVERLEHVDMAVRATGAKVLIGGNRAFYRPSTDTVHMPDDRRFLGEDKKRTEAFYAVLFHEIAHWSGHKSRLNRDMSGKYGDEAYAMEELIAELSSAFICAQLKISPEVRQDHAQYISSWLKVLKQDKKAVFYASARAQEAVNYLL